MGDIQSRIRLSGLTQDEIARAAGIHPSALSRFLRGLRPPPEDFEARVDAALDLLEEAEEAAHEARERVLARGVAA